MTSKFISNASYRDGLALQEKALLSVQANRRLISIFGFEHKPVVTMGVRASLNDLLSIKELKALNFEIVETDRGGQSTLHMPGQLVIYPVMSLPEYELSVKSWICLLAKVTEKVFADFGVPSYWDEKKPGIYSERGKLGAVGVRIRRGVSQHGLCLNVRNSLEPFRWLVPCGVKGLAQDRLSDWGYSGSVEDVFNAWVQHFSTSIDNRANI